MSCCCPPALAIGLGPRKRHASAHPAPPSPTPSPTPSSSYVFDVVRASVPKMELDAVFESKVCWAWALVVVWSRVLVSVWSQKRRQGKGCHCMHKEAGQRLPLHASVAVGHKSGPCATTTGGKGKGAFAVQGSRFELCIAPAAAWSALYTRWCCVSRCNCNASQGTGRPVPAGRLGSCSF